MEAPAGWTGNAFFLRLLIAGVCGVKDLMREPGDGGLTIGEVFELHRALDWRDYVEAITAERAAARHDN